MKRRRQSILCYGYCFMPFLYQKAYRLLPVLEVTENRSSQMLFYIRDAPVMFSTAIYPFIR